MRLLLEVGIYILPRFAPIELFSIFKTDAAHVHSPTGGQGLNCSIQDSVSQTSREVYIIH